MSSLWDLEPRTAGDDEVEPAIEFENKWDDLHDRAECPASIPRRTAVSC